LLSKSECESRLAAGCRSRNDDERRFRFRRHGNRDADSSGTAR
jgi:hypothetical protein